MQLQLFKSCGKYKLEYKAIDLLYESSKFKNYALINIIIVFLIVSFSWYFIGIVKDIEKEMFYVGHLITFF